MLPEYIWFLGRYEVFSLPPPLKDRGNLSVLSNYKEVLGIAKRNELGTIHILRNHERGGRGVGQMLTFDYEGGGGV